MKKILFFLGVFLFSCSTFVQAKTIKLSWDKNIEPDLAGYRIYSGNISNQFNDKPLGVPADSNSYQYKIIDGSQDIYFAVTAINAANIESDLSNEVKMLHFPAPPQKLSLEIIIKIN